MKISELPTAIKIVALQRQKDETDRYYDKYTDSLLKAFEWGKTIEEDDFWRELHNEENINEFTVAEPKHYDNTKGSLYQFCDDKDLNTYEFDIIKRVMRCRKKGLFLEDLEKTKFLIDLYIKEQEEKNK
jgi:hypothetical protein